LVVKQAKNRTGGKDGNRAKKAGGSGAGPRGAYWAQNRRGKGAANGTKGKEERKRRKPSKRRSFEWQEEKKRPKEAIGGERPRTRQNAPERVHGGARKRKKKRKGRNHEP